MKNIEFLLKCTEYDHVGDKSLLSNMFVAIAIQQELQSKGIQLDVSGKLGCGKTDAIRTGLNLVGDPHYIEAVMSDKSIFYNKKIHDGMIVFSDDKKLSSELEGVIKRASSNFQSPNIHQTLTANNHPIDKIMPSRIMWILTAVSSDNSDELLSRCIQSTIDESEQQTLLISKKIKDKAKSIDGDTFLSSDDLNKCNNIFNDIKSKYFLVSIPFSSEIKHIGRRNLNLLFDVIRGYAILDYQDRPQKTVKRVIKLKGSVPVLDANGIQKTYQDGNLKFEDAIVNVSVDAIHIEAIEDDYLRAMNTYGKNEFKPDNTVLTDSEKDILKFIPYGNVDNGITANDLQIKTGLSQSTLSRKMHGIKNRKTRGLLEKVDYIQFQNIAITKKYGDGESKTTHTNVYYRIDEEQKPIVINNNLEQTRLNIKGE
jgi:hypothetical protein